MPKAIGTLLAALAVTTLPAQAAPDKTTFVRFQTPSRNIGCLYSAGLDRRPAYLRCDILSGLKPEPRRACQLDWTGYTLLVRGAARATCAGDTVYDRKARTLGYGKTWKQDGFACTSRRSGLRCTNAAGRGFILARARSRTF